MKVAFTCLAAAVLMGSNLLAAREYRFDGKMSREVLESYLSRSITMQDLLTGKGDLRDNVRMLTSVGAKFAGRTLYLWGHEGDLMRSLELAQRNEPIIHEADPEMILQGCIFEIVTRQVERIAIPAWAFEAFGRPVEQRNFRYEDMTYADGRGKNQWGRDGSIPDVSRPETKLWMYFVAASYINAGIEALHFGQVEIMNWNDRDLRHWEQVLTMVRAYAARHARRHMVICDGHVPGGGLLREGRLLLDFHSFPLRIMEVPERPQEGVLKVGFTDAIYGRSKGGTTPSGWTCDHLPYLVEVDNWGSSRKPGQPGLGGCWVWGYDEMSWFAHQGEPYRNQWLRYAWKWVREHDSNGYLQMPGSRVVHSPVDRKGWYYANQPSSAVPDGFGQEETIRAIWASDSAN